MSFQPFGLDAALLRALDACGFTHPTEIQSKAIPVALSGRDLMASAQTGTGKTAAFTLPILNTLMARPKGRGNGPRALVLTPTRELATQVADVVRDLGRFCHVKHGTVVGGMAFGPQERLLRAPLDVLVATPGRLIDHMERGNVDFTRLEVLVLDEADRMLDMGFLPAVRRIITATPASRQTMLFSATLEGAVLDVAKKHLNNPERVQLAAAKQRHAGITQWMHTASGEPHKRAMLEHLLTDRELSQVVVFTGTKWRAKKLAAQLAELGHASAPLQGNMTQAARQRTVDQMRAGRVRVLVATDVAARGLDVPGISHVINYDLPMVPEDYIHRIGRTGRAGASGIAISLVVPGERRLLADIERLTGRAVERRDLEGLTGTWPASSDDADERPRQPRQQRQARQPFPGRTDNRAGSGRGDQRGEAPRNGRRAEGAGQGGFRAGNGGVRNDGQGGRAEGFRDERRDANAGGGFRSGNGGFRPGEGRGEGVRNDGRDNSAGGFRTEGRSNPPGNSGGFRGNKPGNGGGGFRAGDGGGFRANKPGNAGGNKPFRGNRQGSGRSAAR
ncbi:MAG: DEAD/DEAH box helicase [Nitrospirae bacterium]|nr:DEAD/DEAH box helicase [Nitrospirota bacterium]